jgi:hypothetical protein
MKEQILKLRSEGKTYREIKQLLKCSRSLISYYVSPNGKTKNLQRQTTNRFRKRQEYKNLLGGKCQICGYNKCLDALHFHHKDPSQKRFEIPDALFGRCHAKFSIQEIEAEVHKCILLCANCHHEIHSKNDYSNLSIAQTPPRGGVTD